MARQASWREQDEESTNDFLIRTASINSTSSFSNQDLSGSPLTAKNELIDEDIEHDDLHNSSSGSDSSSFLTSDEGDDSEREELLLHLENVDLGHLKDFVYSLELVPRRRMHRLVRLLSLLLEDTNSENLLLVSNIFLPLIFRPEKTSYMSVRHLRGELGWNLYLVSLQVISTILQINLPTGLKFILPVFSALIRSYHLLQPVFASLGSPKVADEANKLVSTLSSQGMCLRI